MKSSLSILVTVTLCLPKHSSRINGTHHDQLIEGRKITIASVSTGAHQVIAAHGSHINHYLDTIRLGPGTGAERSYTFLNDGANWLAF